MPIVSPGPYHVASTYLRLRSDSSVEPLPVDDSFWPRLIGGQLGTFRHEYLVTTFAFDAPWPSWERHPNGDEVVCLLEGRTTMVLQVDGAERLIELGTSGEFVIVPRGTWHTARPHTHSRMLFITAGEGTETRPA